MAAASAAVRLRCFPLSSRLQYYNHILRANHRPFPPLFSPSSYSQNFRFSSSSGSNGGGGWSKLPIRPIPHSSSSSSLSWVGPIGAFTRGWRSRVAADQQFPFKVLMEQLVGVTASVLGDMLACPNFRLNELDFVFSTLTVASTLNFLLMYLLAATTISTSSAAQSKLPWIFSNCPTSHMFEPGPYSLLHRFGTFLYKGAIFATVGFDAGLAETAISNRLIEMRKEVEPGFVTPNKALPTLLNADMWAILVGLSTSIDTEKTKYYGCKSTDPKKIPYDHRWKDSGREVFRGGGGQRCDGAGVVF